MGGSCPGVVVRGNYSGKNVRAAKVQGTITLGEISLGQQLRGNCPYGEISWETVVQREGQFFRGNCLGGKSLRG